MAKRTTKREIQSFLLIIVIAIIALPVYLIYKFGEIIGWGWFVSVIVVIMVGIVWAKSSREKAQRAEAMRRERLRSEAILKQEQARRAELMGKYGDERVVESILNRSYWQSQTADQLRDSMGHPIDVDEKVLKTKKKEIWKYNPMGGNRFGLRIALENNVVVGWDEKS